MQIRPQFSVPSLALGQVLPSEDVRGVVGEWLGGARSGEAPAVSSEHRAQAVPDGKSQL